MKKWSRFLFTILFFTSAFSFAGTQTHNSFDLNGFSSVPIEESQHFDTRVQKNSNEAFILHLKNNGLFVGYYHLSYYQKIMEVWTRFDYTTPSLTSGMLRSYSIPAGVRDLNVTGYYYTGLVWRPVSALFSVNVDIPFGIKSMQFSMWGTTWNPSWKLSSDFYK